VNFYASIDGGPDVFHAGVRGTVNLTPTPLAAGTHSLRVSYRSGDTVFLGLVLDPGATTVRPALSTKLVEFVGDSITAGALTDKLAVDTDGHPNETGHAKIADRLTPIVAPAIGA
jgi:hypothetical protein